MNTYKDARSFVGILLKVAETTMTAMTPELVKATREEADVIIEKAELFIDGIENFTGEFPFNPSSQQKYDDIIAEFLSLLIVVELSFTLLTGYVSTRGDLEQRVRAMKDKIASKFGAFPPNAILVRLLGSVGITC